MILLVNKKAKFDYEFGKTFQAGIVLGGAEVKSLRNKSGSLRGSFVKIIGNEAFLLNAQITPYKFADNREYDPKKTRKLLLSKKELFELKQWESTKGWSLIPVSFELKNKKIKLNLAVARGKKQFEKREILKQRSIKKDLDRYLKNRV